ncbi:MAG TPA: hypothetical protein H9870_12420 [Candidatus Corynebacterium avicola]|uniref:Uncharacterized protein n=1 Tax=Candidatus Corynebacterium avicola TaxID=2838527 RepID=A0A9D1RQP8_9CORY|nr:hypothetical protein [Candidatus Corynebacterium avicola]
MFFRGRRRRRATQQIPQDDLQPRPDHDTDAPDEMFPHLTAEQGNLLREEAMRTLHDEGFDTVWRPDGYIAATPENRPNTPPRLVGLDNLSLRIAQEPRDTPDADIAKFVRTFVRTVVTDANVDIDALSDADFLRNLKVRLMPTDLLQSTPENAGGAGDGNPNFKDGAREVAGDVSSALVLDTDSAIHTLSDSRLAAHGGDTADGLADLHRVGHRNTWQELVDTPVNVTPVSGDDPGARFWAVESESYFLATAPLFLDGFLTRYIPGLDTSEGVLLAVPHRHLMLVREVSTGTDLLEGINAMTSAAVHQYTENPGAVSPRLYLDHDGDLLSFTDVTSKEDGQQVLQVYPNEHLMRRLNEGDGIGDAGTGDGGANGPSDPDGDGA